MRRKTRQTILAAIAAFQAILLLLFFANRDVVKDPKPPRELPAMAAWIARHPADWPTAVAITESALDSSLPRRNELWRGSYALASHLAPRLRNPRAAFVRGGLFHWYELGPPDRSAILSAVAPLLGDPTVFNDLHQSLFALTHDFPYLLRNAPRDIGSLESLRGIAAANGLFADYRQARAAVARQRLAVFESSHASLAPHEWVELLPLRLTADDEPLVRRILQELQRVPFDPARFGSAATRLITYAVEHDVQPLDALTPFIDSNVTSDALRARLALASGRVEAASAMELASPNAGSPEWKPYTLERARYEAKQGHAAASDRYLRRAAAFSLDVTVLAAAEECAHLLRKDPAQFRQQLAALKQRTWSGTCAANELCGFAETNVYSTGTVDVRADVVQSDRIPPYVEIYADDQRVAEGEVADARTFALPLPRGLHRLEVRLVNPRISNGTQRRVRLS